jgi:hypothetical protein
MANWCWNSVEFRGKKENLQNLLKILDEMVDRSKKLDKGVVPILIEPSEDGYYFYLSIEDHNLNENVEVEEYFIIIRYETKWNPNPEKNKWIGSKFEVDFEHEYEESGSKIYGKCRFTYTDNEEDPICEEKFLSDEEYDQCKYLENDDQTVIYYRDEVSDEKWEELLDEDIWNEMDDNEKLSDTLDDKEWENVN